MSRQCPSPRKSSPAPLKPSLHTFVPSTQKWTIDSGANFHLTPDNRILHKSTPYSGHDDILIGDGKSLPIYHTGSSVFRLKGHLFHFDNVLCSPFITCHLLFVYAPINQNDIFMKFFFNIFFIKDIHTSRVLY